MARKHKQQTAPDATGVVFPQARDEVGFNQLSRDLEKYVERKLDRPSGGIEEWHYNQYEGVFAFKMFARVDLDSDRWSRPVFCYMPAHIRPGTPEDVEAEIERLRAERLMLPYAASIRPKRLGLRPAFEDTQLHRVLTVPK